MGQVPIPTKVRLQKTSRSEKNYIPSLKWLKAGTGDVLEYTKPDAGEAPLLCTLERVPEGLKQMNKPMVAVLRSHFKSAFPQINFRTIISPSL
jgi:hypothetical protein